MLNVLKQFMGVGNDTLWLIISTFAVATLPGLIKLPSVVNANRWKIRKRTEGNAVYPFIIFYAVIVGCIAITIYTVFDIFGIPREICIVIAAIVTFLLIWFINRRKFVRRRLLHKIERDCFFWLMRLS